MLRIVKKFKRYLISGVAVLLLVLIWQLAQADGPAPSTSPAHRQVKQIMGSLMDSEAEHAAGSYFPGQGAFITLRLLRGPNSVNGKPAYAGTRDWIIYLMQNFGGKLTAVPPEETIGISVDFYDYSVLTYRQLAILSKAADIKDPAKYKVWLDGRTYDEAVSGQPAPAQTQAPQKAATPAPQTTANNPATAAQTQVPATAATQAPAATVAAGKVAVNYNLANADKNIVAQWLPLNGKWDFTDQGYVQSELGKFDLITLLNQPVSGKYRLQANLKFGEGEMGGGLVFNMPLNSTKANGYMVSYTGKGTYMQWGYFDQGGIFQFQGGIGVPNGADGQPHTLAVEVDGNNYEIFLDGVSVSQKVNMLPNITAGGYSGLLASTSRVIFNNIKLESK